MAELGLSHVANTRCGDEFLRGIRCVLVVSDGTSVHWCCACSGGERRRVSVAAELVTGAMSLPVSCIFVLNAWADADAPVLVVDEPTSGLDRWVVNVACVVI